MAVLARRTWPPAAPSRTGRGPFDVVVPVAKLHAYGAARAWPARSLAPVEMVAVKEAPVARLLLGVKVAVEPEEVTVPDTVELPCFTVNELAVNVAGSIAALKVAATVTLRGTPEPSLEGLVELTVGAMPPALSPGGVESLPHAASREVRTRALHKRMLRRVTIEVLQSYETQLWAGNYNDQRKARSAGVKRVSFVPRSPSRVYIWCSRTFADVRRTRMMIATSTRRFSPAETRSSALRSLEAAECRAPREGTAHAAAAVYSLRPAPVLPRRAIPSGSRRSRPRPTDRRGTGACR